MNREITNIGILAYGSLIEDPGKEIGPLIESRLEGVMTPFPVEIARKSSTRDGAPTVVPVDKGGAQVRAQIMILKEEVGLAKAEDLLWRRETRNEETEKHYSRPDHLGPNTVVIEHSDDFEICSTVIYTRIGANIPNPDPATLADLAIHSARSEAGVNGCDGISYLISLKRNGISTPLMLAYEEEVLRKTGAATLEKALVRCRGGVANREWKPTNRE